MPQTPTTSAMLSPMTVGVDMANQKISGGQDDDHDKSPGLVLERRSRPAANAVMTTIVP